MEWAVVRSLAGRDSGELFFVVGVEEPYLLLCDGKHRRLSAPKRKKRRHTEPAWAYARKLDRQTPVTDNEIRRALAAFRAQSRRV